MKDPLPRTQNPSTKLKSESKSPKRAKLTPKTEEIHDLGFLESLKSEWNLFWENIVGDEDRAADSGSRESEKEAFASGKLEKLSLEQIKAITKVLSQDRAQLNQKLEQINRELEETIAKAQSLSLVGGDFEFAQTKTSELSELGHQIAGDLMKLDAQLKLTRRHEDILKKRNLLLK